MSDVKFPLFIEKGPIDVELHDEGLLAAIVVFLFCFHDAVQLIYFIDYGNTIASVCQFSRLHYPNVPQPFPPLASF
jgi:hypothetical protein